MNITAIILTYNESIHLKRCIESIHEITKEIIVIDSYSTDNTVEIARELGATVHQRKFINQAEQFQWGLDNLPIQTEWIMRLDADEYLLPELCREIKYKIPLTPPEVSAYLLKRRVYFMDRWIRYGGYYPTKLLRLWRTGLGTVEQRWMDEHIVVSTGQVSELDNDFVDHNLNNLTWWTEKHNHYSTREATDLLNQEYGFLNNNSTSEKLNSEQQSAQKRFLKNRVYSKCPLLLRAFLYFSLRYFGQRGFLDGKAGFIWHVLQGFWYRFLVDAKIQQIMHIANRDGRSVQNILKQDFKIKL